MKARMRVIDGWLLRIRRLVEEDMVSRERGVIERKPQACRVRVVPQPERSRERQRLRFSHYLPQLVELFLA